MSSAISEGALQRNAIEKRFNLFRRWRASEFAISHSADDFVTERTVGIGAKSNGEEPDKTNVRRDICRTDWTGFIGLTGLDSEAVSL